MPAGMRVQVVNNLETFDRVCSFGHQRHFGHHKCPLIKLPTIPALAKKTETLCTGL